MLNMEKRKKWFKDYYRNNKDSYRKRERVWGLKRRHRLFKLMGDKCVECGFNDKRALQIDHINDDGHIVRKTMSQKMELSYFLNNPEDIPNKIQLLCANCNTIKEYNRKKIFDNP